MEFEEEKDLSGGVAYSSEINARAGEFMKQHKRIFIWICFPLTQDGNPQGSVRVYWMDWRDKQPARKSRGFGRRGLLHVPFHYWIGLGMTTHSLTRGVMFQ